MIHFLSRLYWRLFSELHHFIVAVLPFVATKEFTIVILAIIVILAVAALQTALAARVSE